MESIGRFKRSNQEFIDLAFRIENQLLSKEAANDIFNLSTLISRLLSGLDTHIATEIEILFPHYLKSDNEKLKKLILKLKDDIFILSKSIAEYKSRWVSLNNIQDNSTTHMKETRTLLISIVNHANNENDVLYPLIDKEYFRQLIISKVA